MLRPAGDTEQVAYELGKEICTRSEGLFCCFHRLTAVLPPPDVKISSPGGIHADVPTSGLMTGAVAGMVVVAVLAAAAVVYRRRVA